jgi:hypothetical protein
MSDLPRLVIDRHGSTDRWHQGSAISAAAGSAACVS